MKLKTSSKATNSSYKVVGRLFHPADMASTIIGGPESIVDIHNAAGRWLMKTYSKEGTIDTRDRLVQN
jgi:hypothetical protein